MTSRVYDQKAILGAPALSEDAQRGRTIWVQRCALCHDGVGQPTYKTMGPWLDRDIIQQITEEGARAFIAAGTERMPGFRYTLLPKQVDQVIAFLKTVSPNQQPTAAQLAGRAPDAPAASE